MKMTNAICDNPGCPSDACQLHQARERISVLEDALREAKPQIYSPNSPTHTLIDRLLKTDINGAKAHFTQPSDGEANG